ncbi:peptide chain release factor N(5)-glutamine methyltransferase [Thiomonas sp.]|uniref:peptide chain release factor N(5)-glutamine methyltransferase n=1 Tax=Thiomonas sp. TaxID=2047785 RepID=UPI002611191C|nr:peptide chain release factor N(5)-glutamine methyltransferase [Thiomonas sp.]
MRSSALERVDALALLRELAGLSHATLLAHPETPLDDARLRALEQAAARLRAGEPLAYVLGWREFWGLRLSVGPEVLIPRPETELLVEFALARLDADAAADVLDLGTGSGAIAIAVAHERAHARVQAVDTSAEALRIARGNARRLLEPDRPGGALRWHHGDWMGALPGADETFDLILSNPPYVAEGDEHLQSLRFEPRLALVGSRGADDGLGDIRDLIAQAAPRLRAGGWLALEHGYDQAEGVRALLRAAGLLEAHSLRDLAGIERVTAARAPD